MSWIDDSVSKAMIRDTKKKLKATIIDQYNRLIECEYDRDEAVAAIKGQILTISPEHWPLVELWLSKKERGE
jgi:hypothetical protein